MHAYSFLFQDILDFCHFLKVKSYHGFDQNSLFVVSSLHWFDLLDNFGKGFANLAKNFSRGFPNGPKMKKKRQGHSFFNLVYYETADITWNLFQLQNLGIVPNTYLEIVFDSILGSSNSALVHNEASQGSSYKAFKNRCSDLWETLASSFCYYRTMPFKSPICTC